MEGWIRKRSAIFKFFFVTNRVLSSVWNLSSPIKLNDISTRFSFVVYGKTQRLYYAIFKFVFSLYLPIAFLWNKTK